MNKNTSGFTLVELLIVIVIIAILAAITVVAYNGIQTRAIASGNISNFQTYQNLIEQYKAVNGSYPSTSGAFTYQRNSGDTFIPGLVPNFATALPVAPTGDSTSKFHNTYIYRSDGTNYYSLCYLDQDQTPARGLSAVASQYKSGTYTDRYGVWSGTIASC